MCESLFFLVIPIPATHSPPSPGAFLSRLLTWEGDTLSGGLMFLWAPQSVDLSDPFQLFLAAAPKLAGAQWVAGRFAPWKTRS